MRLLESSIKNFALYAPYLQENTLDALADLVLEDMIPSEGLMQNLVLRDTGQITPEEFSQREMQRIMNEPKHTAIIPLITHTQTTLSVKESKQRYADY